MKGTDFHLHSLLSDGELLPVWVVRATRSHVVVSLSHPYAGKTLTFQLDVVRVRDASPEELASGRAHGLDPASPAR